MSASNDLSMYLDRDTVSAYAREAMEWRWAPAFWWRIRP